MFLFMIDKVNVLFIIGTVLFIICDNFKMLINKNSLSVRKSTFVLPVVLSLLLCMVEYGLLIMTVGDKALVDISYIGFLELSFMPVTKYIGDFNFVYIYLLLICCVFKNGFNLSLIKNSLSLNKNVFNLIIVFVLTFCSIIILNSIEISMLYPYLFLIVLLNINIFWMIGKCYFVRKG